MRDKKLKIGDLKRPRPNMGDQKSPKLPLDLTVYMALHYISFSLSLFLSLSLSSFLSHPLFLNSQSYQTEHVNQLTSVYHNLGMLVTGSKDKSAMIHSMSQPHSCLKTIDHVQDVTDVREKIIFL